MTVRRLYVTLATTVQPALMSKSSVNLELSMMPKASLSARLAHLETTVTKVALLPPSLASTTDLNIGTAQWDLSILRFVMREHMPITRSSVWLAQQDHTAHQMWMEPDNLSETEFKLCVTMMLDSFATVEHSLHSQSMRDLSTSREDPQLTTSTMDLSSEDTM